MQRFSEDVQNLDKAVVSSLKLQADLELVTKTIVSILPENCEGENHGRV